MASGCTSSRAGMLAGVRLAALTLLLAAAGQAGASALTQAQQVQLARGKAQVLAGQGAQAYVLLEPLERILAGQADFDLLLGQAALAANQPTRAAFAFDRCLAVQPLNGTCRLGMARAHMMLDEIVGARNELELISRSSPPAEVQRVIDDYLAQLTNRQSGGQDTRLRAYVQAGVGYDSNFNHATAQGALALPLFNNAVFRLTREGQARDSGFNLAQLNVSYSTPIAQNWRFLADGSVASSLYWATHEYNTLISDASVGVAWRRNSHQVTLKAMGQNYRLGGSSYRNLVGVLGQYAYTVSQQAELNAFAHVSRLSYPQDGVRNAHRTTAGLSWSQVVFNDKAVLYASAYGGKEAAVRGDAPDILDYRFGGLRLGGMALLGPRTQLEFGVGAERRRHDGRDTLFLAQRKETVYDANLGVNYALNRKWSIRPAYRYTRSKSTIPLRDYQRHAFTVNLRYELL